MLTTVVSEPRTGFNCGTSWGRRVSLHAEKDNINRPHFFKRAHDGGARHEISVAAFHLHAVLLQGAKMGASRKKRDVEPCPRHARANVGADCARSRDQEFHAC